MNMHKPLVTVITPCYNEESRLDDYFNSVLSQQYERIQLIFVNDGSTDHSEAVVTKYKNRLEAKLDFQYLFQNNTGYISAINNALDYVKGEYVCFFDADDMMMPHKIKSHVDYLEAHPGIHLVYSDGFRVHESEINKPFGTFLEKIATPPEGNVYELIYANNFLKSGTYCFRRECLDIFGKFEDKFHNRGQNLQLLAAVTRYYKVGYNHVEPVMKYRMRYNSMSHSKSPKNIMFQTFVRKELDYFLIDKYGATDVMIAKIEDKYVRRELKYYFVNGDKKRFKGTFKKAIRLLRFKQKIKSLILFFCFFIAPLRLYVIRKKI